MKWDQQSRFNLKIKTQKHDKLQVECLPLPAQTEECQADPDPTYISAIQPHVVISISESDLQNFGV